MHTKKTHRIYLLVGRQGETHGGRGGVVVDVDEVAKVEGERGHVPSLRRLFNWKVNPPQNRQFIVHFH